MPAVPDTVPAGMEHKEEEEEELPAVPNHDPLGKYIRVVVFL
jgi:hypothetical protein